MPIAASVVEGCATLGFAGFDSRVDLEYLGLVLGGEEVVEEGEVIGSACPVEDCASRSIFYGLECGGFVFLDDAYISIFCSIEDYGSVLFVDVN